MAQTTIASVKLKIRENLGKTNFKGNDYYKYHIDDSYGHYFTKLLQGDYPAGTEIEFAVHSYKGAISLKAVGAYL